MIEIKNRYTGAVIMTVEAETLKGANLRDANLRGAYLRGAYLPESPKVDNLPALILGQIEKEPKCLEMTKWHSDCGSTHCMAGWAVHLAGEAGYALEEKIGPNAAGALIFNASGYKVPDFFATNEAALQELKEMAGV